MDDAAVAVAGATIGSAALAVFIIATFTVTAEGTFAAILRTGIASLAKETLPVTAERQDSVTHRTVVGRLGGTEVVPTLLAAIGIDFTDEIYAHKVIAPGAIMGLAATTRTLPAIVGAGTAGLGLGANAVAADIGHLAGAAVQGLHFVDAEIVPVDVAAVGVGSADTGFNWFLLTPGVAVGRAAIAVAGATLIRFTGAKSVPLYVAAVGVLSADTTLDIGIGATRSPV